MHDESGFKQTVYFGARLSGVFFFDHSGLIRGEDYTMKTRVAVMGIIVENTDSINVLNGILHDYGEYVVGRVGIPYREKGINIISVAVDAPQDVISAMTGKIGRLQGIEVKTAYSSVAFGRERKVAIKDINPDDR